MLSLLRKLLPALLFSLVASGALAGQSLSPATYNQLNDIQGYLGESSFAEAKTALDDLIADLKPGFGMALACELYGQYFLLQEQPQQALSWYQKSLAQNALPPAQEAGLATTAAQLLMTQDEYAAAVALLKSRLDTIMALEAKQKEDAPPIIQPLAFYTLGSAYHLQQNYQQAVLWVQRAADRAQARGETVKEAWLQMLMAGHYQLKNYQRTADVLDDLLRMNPQKEDYWVQQASMYQLLEKPEKALRALELGYAGGYLHKQDGILFMVQLMMAQNLPERAARILSAHLADGSVELNERNWRLTAMAWQQGRERDKAVTAMINAAGFMEDGSLLYLAAQVAQQNGDFTTALQQAQAAISKGLADDKLARAKMLAGNAAFELKDMQTARRYFQQGLADAATAANARSWLDYIAALEEY